MVNAERMCIYCKLRVVIAWHWLEALTVHVHGDFCREQRYKLKLRLVQR